MTLPVDPATLAAFALTVAAIVISPGPDTMLILRSSLTSGIGGGLAAVTGVQLGLIVHTVLAVVGITAVVASSALLFKAVALAGAGYLAWLGIGGLRGRGALSLGSAGPRVRARVCCRDAMLTNILNPKVIVLFFALYPNFIRLGGGDVIAQILLLSATLILINAVWQVGLAWSADRARRWLGRPAAQIWIGRITGAILLSFAVAMVWQHVRFD